MPLTFSGFSLGTGPSIDPNEGNTNAENAAGIVGQTYGGLNNALANQIVSITSQNVGGSSTALDQNNNAAADSFVVDGGNGSVTYGFDAAAQYNITISYTDGSTANVTGVVFQSTTGELFLAPGITAGGAYNAALEAGAIRSVTINNVVGSNFTGLAADRAALNFPTCFAAGTLIATAGGARRVDSLAPGDLVLTRDHGAQALRWVGGARFSAGRVAADDRLRPVAIRAGALGPGVPARDLLLSRQHRVLACGPIAQRLFGSDEVLLAAVHLLGLPGVNPAPAAEVGYWHLLFDRHEVICAEGAPAESLQGGPQAAASLSPMARAEIALLLPGFPLARGFPPARPVLDGPKARDLVRRHVMHGRPLVPPAPIPAIRAA